MKDHFNFDSFKNDDQEKAIQAIIGNKPERKDFIISMATLGGKSFIYQLLGGMEKSGLTIVITPSIALANDIIHFLAKHNFSAIFINSEMSFEERNRVILDKYEGKSKYEFLFLTPEMLVSSFRMNEGETILEFLMGHKLVNYLIIEDAHKVLDSSDFRPSFETIKNYNYRDVVCVALTTGNDQIIQNIANKLLMDNPKIFKSSCDRTNILYEAKIAENYSVMVEDIKTLAQKEGGEIQSGIIYCRTIADGDAITKFLSDNNIKANSFNAQMYSYDDREKIINNWAVGIFSVLVATSESFGFGISHNVPTIRFVYHWAAPKNLQSFYQVRIFMIKFQGDSPVDK
jgi:superfamily II DNA helicase RecQ